MSSNNFRAVYNILVFLSIIFCPWWIYLPILLIGLIFFPLYIEGILFGFIIDAAYGVIPNGNIFLHFPVALLATLVVIILIPVREKIRLHA